MSNSSYGVVYIITCLVTGKRYVGQTVRKNPLRRFASHFWAGRSRSALRSAIEKYGRSAFEFDIIYRASSQKDLNSAEVRLIERLGTLSPGGYNLRSGGDGGGRHSRKTIEAYIVLRNAPEQVARQSATQRIVQNRPEVKARQRAGVLSAYADPEVRARHITAAKKAAARPETLLAMCAAQQINQKRPEVAARRQAGLLAAMPQMSESRKKLRWITDGLLSRRIHKDLPLPLGWRFGRVFPGHRVEF